MQNQQMSVPLRVLFTIILFSGFGITHAQPPTFNWASRITSTVNQLDIKDMVRAANGDIYVLGHTPSTTATTTLNPDDAVPSTLATTVQTIYLSKYSANGTFAWSFVIGTGIASTLKLGPNGMLYVLAQLNANSDVDPSSGTTTLNVNNSVGDQLVAKYDISFDPSSTSFFKWGFMLGGTGTENPTGLEVDANSMVYVTLQYANAFDADPSANTNTLPYTGSFRIGVMKYNGTLLPNNVLFHQWGFSIAGSANVISGKVVAKSDGSFILSGRFFGATCNPNPAGDATITKTTSQYDVFLASYNGNLLPTNPLFHEWSFAVTGATGTDNWYDMALDASENLYIVGGFATGLVDFDPGPATVTQVSNGGTDCVVTKYNTALTPTDAGFFQWLFQPFCTNAEEGLEVELDAAGMVYIFGRFSGSLNANPAGSSTTLISAGSDDVFAAKYDGQLLPSNPLFFKWSFNLGGTSQDVAECMTVSTSGSVTIGGRFRGTSIDFDPTAGSLVLSSGGATLDGVFMGNYSTSNLATLPVNFTNIRVFRKPNGHQLEWEVSEEADIHSYTIQRSGDGLTFNSIGSVQSNGNNSTAQYGWLDENPLAADNYYRIKSTGLNNEVKYTRIVILRSSKGNPSVSLFPNPVTGHKVTLQLNNLTKGEYTLSVYNALGQAVMTSRLMHKGGTSLEQLLLPATIPAGMYTVELKNELTKLVQQVMVK